MLQYPLIRVNGNIYKLIGINWGLDFYKEGDVENIVLEAKLPITCINQLKRANDVAIQFYDKNNEAVLVTIDKQ